MPPFAYKSGLRTLSQEKGFVILLLAPVSVNRRIYRVFRFFKSLRADPAPSTRFSSKKNRLYGGKGNNIFYLSGLGVWSMSVIAVVPLASH